MSAVIITELEALEDPRLGRQEWNRLVALGDTDEVFLSYSWQLAWWTEFGRGRRLLLLATRGGQGCALASLFSDAGMVYFTGSGGSDYLDFVGDISDCQILDSLLLAAQERTENFIGFTFYLIPDTSRTAERLHRAAARIGMRCHQESSICAPSLSLRGPEAVAATQKKSLVRHESALRRTAELQVQHLTDPRAILEGLPGFFEEHIGRSAAAGRASLFLEPSQRRFYARLAVAGANEGWLRFTRVVWDGRPVAHHFGFCHRGRYLWYKPSFEIALARKSPGEVLLRQLILSALEEDAHTFDFGIGDEPFKRRFATHGRQVTTWSLYPA